MNYFRLSVSNTYVSLRERAACIRVDFNKSEIPFTFSSVLGNIFNSFSTLTRSLAHNPFSLHDQYNRKLFDRHLFSFVRDYRDGKAENKRLDGYWSAPRKAVLDSLKVKENFKSANNYNLAIFADACVGLPQVIINAFWENYKGELLADASPHKPNIPLHLFRKTIVDLRWKLVFSEIKEGDSKNFATAFKEELKLKNEHHTNFLVSSKAKSLLESRTEALTNTVLREFPLDLGLFISEILLSFISPALLFSFTTGLGCASFSFSFFIVLLSLHKAVPYMVGAWRQLASYDNGDKVANALPIQGPNTWAEAKKNIYKHVQESWDKAVDTDQTFHPLVSAFMDAIIVTAAWATLAHFGYTSHALFYLFLDGYNNVKSSLILGKDKDTFRRDFVVACIGGIVRGFFKNMQKSSIFLNNASYSIMRSYYLAMITFTCVIFGHILRLALIQALPVEKSKEMMTKAYLMDIFKSIQARCNSIHAQAVAYKEHYLGGQKTKTA